MDQKTQPARNHSETDMETDMETGMERMAEMAGMSEKAFSLLVRAVCRLEGQDPAQASEDYLTSLAIRATFWLARNPHEDDTLLVFRLAEVPEGEEDEDLPCDLPL